jgi:PhnB protein
MSVQGVPEGHHSVTPYLIVQNVPGLLKFMGRAFDAEVVLKTHRPDGTVGHAEVRIGDSKVMMGEASEQWPAMPAGLHLYVPDVDAVYRRALDAGATSVMAPADQFYGDRSGGVLDAFGNTWWIATQIEKLDAEEIERRAQQQATAGG